MSIFARLILFLACIATVWAGPKDFPACALPCVEISAIRVGCPGYDFLHIYFQFQVSLRFFFSLDSSCLCADDSFSSETLSCAEPICGASEYKQAVQALTTLCRSAGTYVGFQTSSHIQPSTLSRD